MWWPVSARLPDSPAKCSELLIFSRLQKLSNLWKSTWKMNLQFRGRSAELFPEKTNPREFEQSQPSLAPTLTSGCQTRTGLDGISLSKTWLELEFTQTFYKDRLCTCSCISSRRLVPFTAVEDVLQLYKAIWFHPRHSLIHQENYDQFVIPAGICLLDMFESVDIEYREHCVRRSFEGLLLAALDNPCAIDFLIQTCWTALELISQDQGRKSFIQWLEGLAIVPQPENRFHA